MEKKRKKKSTGKWFMVLFGLPFLCVGIGVTWWAARMWLLYFESETWVETPVTIVSTDFNVDHGDDSTTYSVDCLYTYTVSGKTYRADRVGLEAGCSSDAYHHRRYNLLKQHCDNEEPFTALVDPEDPSKTILFREITTTLYIIPLFGLLFGAAGLAVMSIGLRSLVRSSRAKARLRRYPDQPWIANKQWQSFAVRGNPVAKILAPIGVAIFVGIFVSMFVIALHGDKGAPFFAKAIVGSFCLIPFAALGVAIYHLFRYFKYGNPTLAFTRMPCVIGEENTVLVYVRTRIATEDGFDVEIKCMEKQWRQQGNKSTLSEIPVYREKLKVTEDMAKNSGTSAAIPIRFTLPAGEHETFDTELPGYRWNISIKAKTPGIDFAANFNVPVYEVSDPSLIQHNPKL